MVNVVMLATGGSTPEFRKTLPDPVKSSAVMSTLGHVSLTAVSARPKRGVGIGKTMRGNVCKVMVIINRLGACADLQLKVEGMSHQAGFLGEESGKITKYPLTLPFRH